MNSINMWIDPAYWNTLVFYLTYQIWNSKICFSNSDNKSQLHAVLLHCYYLWQLQMFWHDNNWGFIITVLQSNETCVPYKRYIWCFRWSCMSQNNMWAIYCQKSSSNFRIMCWRIFVYNFIVIVYAWIRVAWLWFVWDFSELFFSV